MVGEMNFSSQEYKTYNIDSILQFGTFQLYMYLYLVASWCRTLSRFSILWEIDLEKKKGSPKNLTVCKYSMYMEIWILAWMKNFHYAQIQGFSDGIVRLVSVGLLTDNDDSCDDLIPDSFSMLQICTDWSPNWTNSDSEIGINWLKLAIMG